MEGFFGNIRTGQSGIRSGMLVGLLSSCAAAAAVELRCRCSRIVAAVQLRRRRRRCSSVSPPCSCVVAAAAAAVAVAAPPRSAPREPPHLLTLPPPPRPSAAELSVLPVPADTWNLRPERRLHTDAGRGFRDRPPGTEAEAADVAVRQVHAGDARGLRGEDCRHGRRPVRRAAREGGPGRRRRGDRADAHAHPRHAHGARGRQVQGRPGLQPGAAAGRLPCHPFERALPGALHARRRKVPHARQRLPAVSHDARSGKR